MKKLIFTFLLLTVCVITNSQEESWYVNYPLAGDNFENSNKIKFKNQRAEISLYDKTGYAKAYLEAREKPGANDFTFYLWNGSPVAYISQVHNGRGHIYNFNGKHLGWIQSGICFDNNGYAVCAIKARIKMATYAKSAKGAKKASRYKGAKESVPARPVFKHEWSSTSLEEFFYY